MIFAGVLYHLEDPMGAIRKLASLTNEVAIIRTVAVEVPRVDTATWEFYPEAELEGDSSNWWAPNRSALKGAATTAGFTKFESRSQSPTADDAVVRYILTAQAWKAARSRRHSAAGFGADRPRPSWSIEQVLSTGPPFTTLKHPHDS